MPYHVQTFHNVASFPVGLFLRRNLTAHVVLTRYISCPEDFLRGIAVRQAIKVRNALQAFHNSGFNTPCAVADKILHRVRALQERNYRPFFIMGAGGSGSTWLGAMLGDLRGFCYGGEIYTPLGLSYLYRFRKSREMADLIWAIMLLHSWASTGPAVVFDCEFVNSGRSVFQYPLYREIWPTGRFVYLVRDPRDQVLSTTYRKARYRKAVAPGVDDLRYLKHNAKKYMSIYGAFAKLNRHQVYILKYEQLVQNRVDQLTKLLQWAEVKVDEGGLSTVVNLHDADRMRNGEVAWRGNLDEGGRAESWRQRMTEQERNVIKPILQKAIEAFGYEKDSGW